MGVLVKKAGAFKELQGGVVDGKVLSALWWNDSGTWKKMWENWKYKTGNLVKMTSNSMNGYTASKSGGFDGGVAYYAFNGTASDMNLLSTNNPNSTGEPYVKLLFPSPIRIAEIQSWIGYGAGAVTDKNYFHIYGIKADGTEVDLGTNDSGDTWTNLENNNNVDSAKKTHTVSQANQQIEFKGIIARRIKSGAGYYRIAEIKITKWYQKGN